MAVGGQWLSSGRNQDLRGEKLEKLDASLVWAMWRCDRILHDVVGPSTPSPPRQYLSFGRVLNPPSFAEVPSNAIKAHSVSREIHLNAEHLI